MSELPWMIPATIWLLATLIRWAPHWTGRDAMSTDHVPGITVLLAVTIFASVGWVACLAVALAAALHAWRAWPHTRTGAVTLAVSGGGAMPGTAGFIADDLLLHALWEESVPATVTMIMGSAVLAVATLQSWSRIFLGKPIPSLAPDLAFRERAVVVGLVLLLVWLGVTPGVLLTPAETFLGGSEHMLVSD